MENLQKYIDKTVNFLGAIGYRPHCYPLPIGMIESEIRVLTKYCLMAPVGGVLLEIGSFFGGSACILAACSEVRKNNELIVSVDKFQEIPVDLGLGSVQNYNNIMNHIGWTNYLLINEDSAKSRPTYNKLCGKSISFLFIDGGHRYHECKGDFYAYHDLVIPGGYICFHDCGDTDKEELRTEEEILAENREYDVTPFCKRVCDNHSEYMCVEKVREGNSIYVIQKQ